LGTTAIFFNPLIAEVKLREWLGDVVLHRISYNTRPRIDGRRVRPILHSLPVLLKQHACRG
jgi:hypothetical protein